MRVLILSSEYPPGPGGIGTHAYQLSRQLHQLGWHVSVITRQDYVQAQEADQFNAQQDFEVIRLRPQSNAVVDAAYRWQLSTRVVARYGADMVVATGARAVWVAALLPLRIPLVAIGHGTEFGVHSAWEHALTRWAFQRANLVICVSQFTAEYMRSVGIRPRATKVIPNGADDKQFRVLPLAEVEHVRRQHNLEAGPLLLTVGHVNERKGQHVVVQALPEIIEEFPSVHYLMAGLPTDRPSLLSLADKLGVSKHIHFLGRVDNETLAKLVNACAIFMMTSCYTQDGDFEGYGIAVVEAALCGKPAIVSDNSGLAEAIIDGETGVLVPQNDPLRTAQAVIALLKNDPRRTQMGKAALQRASGEQTWAKRAVLYHEEFMRLCNQCDS